MKVKLFLMMLSFLIATLHVFGQPFLTGHTTLTFQDITRNNRTIDAEIYYPANVAGNNVPVAINGGPYPLVVFGHGFVMTWTAYENIWLALNQAGYIVVFPTTEGGFAPNHTEFAKDIAFLVTAMQNEGQTVSSIFNNHITSTSAVMGHSMGGGSSILSVQYNPTITALVNLAAAETNPSAIAACPAITVPALVIAGANDCITPPVSNQLPMYNALGSSCKTYVSITGGSHCQFANSNFNCSFGELTCSPSPTITRTVQQTIVNQVLIPWLDFYLKNDCNAGNTFDSLANNPIGFTVLKNCILCVSSGVNVSSSQSEFSVYPTIASEILHISSTHADVNNLHLVIMDLNGKVIKQAYGKGGLNQIYKLSVGKLNPGIYFIKINSDSGIPVIKKFIKI